MGKPASTTPTQETAASGEKCCAHPILSLDNEKRLDCNACGKSWERENDFKPWIEVQKPAAPAQA